MTHKNETTTTTDHTRLHRIAKLERSLLGFPNCLVIVYHANHDDKVFKGHENDIQKFKKQARNYIRRVLNDSIKNAAAYDIEETVEGLIIHHIHMTPSEVDYS